MELSQARGLYTQVLIDVYQERIKPQGFLRSFFPSTFRRSKLVSIEVERTTEKVAVDVIRGSEGNLNRFSKSTEKVWEPPFWREYFNATELDVYDRVIGSTAGDNTRLFADLMNDVGDRIGSLQDKIERAKEILCAQVLQTGILTTTIGDNIDFKRRAESIVDLNTAGGYFSTDSDVFDQFRAGCEFLRIFGKVTAMNGFVAILGATVIKDLFDNQVFKDRQNLFSMKLDVIQPPQAKASGGVYHGTITCGPYTVQLWSYPDFHEDANGDMVPYIDDDNFVLLPPAPRFKFAHCLVPQVVMPGTTIAPQDGEWVYGDYIDERKAKHDFDVQCAGLPVPVAVDQVYTAKAAA